MTLRSRRFTHRRHQRQMLLQNPHPQREGMTPFWHHLLEGPHQAQQRQQVFKLRHQRHQARQQHHLRRQRHQALQHLLGHWRR